MNRIFLFCFALLLSPFISAQQKRALTIDDLASWRRITERVISDDGSLAAFKTEPWKGDPEVILYNSQAVAIASFNCATGINITHDSRFLVFTIKPSEDSIRVLRLKKTKKEDMPADMLGIYEISSGKTDTIFRLRSFKLPLKWSGWIAWQTEPLKEKTAVQNDTVKSRSDDRRTAKTQSADNGYHLFIRNLYSGHTDTVRYVTDYLFAEEAEVIMLATTGDDKGVEPGIVLIDLGKDTRTVIYTGKARYRQLALDKKGERAAFLVSFDDKDKAGNTFSLCYWGGKGLATTVATAGSAGIPEGWIINENARLTFAEKSPRLFFGTSPSYKLKDTTILDEERPNVDVWHYAEGRLHSVQVISKPRDLKNSFAAVWHAGLNKVVQLADIERPEVHLTAKGDGNKVVVLSNKPYELESMWEGSYKYDVWLMDIVTGMSQRIKEACRASIRVSPAGRYLYWYQSADSSWYSYDISGGREHRLTSPSTVAVWDEENDVPDAAGSYPPAGWLKDDRAFLVSDRYDIWSLDPVNGRPPERITGDGREKRIRYRILDLDPEKEFIDPSEKQYLHGRDEVTRSEAFYSLDIRKRALPIRLTGGDVSLGTPLKAKNSDAVIYTRENFTLFPDYWLTDLSFNGEKRLTQVNPQQNEFLWGTAELVKWTSLDGREIEGLLYKPADFDPSVKYPMIVNFYEKSSSELYRHRIPEPGRSTIDYHYYTSNGYLVFNPDVWYRNGYPGQSAFNCVMPGVMSLIERGFVDEKRIGAQGHSWGGYQVAYLATRTKLFAAIESGAPVANMYSAYGGIRWETGLNRAMQYEHEQSRIGASIWEAPHLYWENSPLFAIDKIETPILIMSNDQDGHVPWWQGIEFFIALRRLGKPSWLLNYTGEPHWPLKMPNKVDFQKRMAQFFNHYLKGEPMPEWMKEGIPAIEKDFTLGY